MSEIKDYTIVLVPGFLTQLYAAFSSTANAVSTQRLIDAAKKVPVVGEKLSELIPRLKLPVDHDTGLSFAAQEKAFKERGIEYVDMGKHPDFSTQNGVEANGEVLRTALHEMPDRRFLILSHSKGGLDTLEALIKADESQRARIHGWLALQAPFGGSPVADVLPSQLSSALMKALGDGRALEDLKVSSRAAYMERHGVAIGRVTQEIRVRSAYSAYVAHPGSSFANAAKQLAASVFDPTVLAEIARIVWDNGKKYFPHPLTALEHDIIDANALIAARFDRTSRKVLGQFGLMDTTNLLVSERNDGLVPESSTRLPGADSIELSPPTDHAGPVMNSAPFHNFWDSDQRVTETEALLSSLIS